MKLFRKINHQYEIEFKETLHFDWKYQMGPVSYEGYEVLATSLDYITETLNADPYSRRAILTLNTRDYMSCLISIQWLIEDETLYCVANFRSQHEEWGRLQDSKLILWLTTEVKYQLEMPIEKVQIDVNVADYHSYE